MKPKVVLLGESAVGKSSLAVRFVKGAFNDFQESTIGAAFMTKTIEVDLGGGDTVPTAPAGGDASSRASPSPPSSSASAPLSVKVKFEIWDTAGQERYHSLAPMYYRGAAAALVVYDITSEDSFDRAKMWVRELQRQASPTIVIALVGNKADLEAERTVEAEGAVDYAAENGLLFVETSAKTAVGVEELFRDIARKLPRAAPATAAVAQQQGQQGGAGFTLSGGRLGAAAQQPCSSCAV